jgi:hypothetical protein
MFTPAAPYQSFEVVRVLPLAGAAARVSVENALHAFEESVTEVVFDRRQPRVGGAHDGHVR